MDKVYKIGKIIAVYSFSILMLSAICKIWCGGCCGSTYKKTCAVSPCKVGNYEDAEVAVFAWDSDSGDIDIEALLNSQDHSHEFDEEIKSIIKKAVKDIEIEVDGDAEVKKKVMVKVIEE